MLLLQPRACATVDEHRAALCVLMVSATTGSYCVPTPTGCGTGQSELVRYYLDGRPETRSVACQRAEQGALWSLDSTGRM